LGVPSRYRSLLSSEKAVTYALILRRKAKTAASQPLPGRVQDGLLVMCFKSIEILVKRLEWMAVVPNFRTPLTNLIGRSRWREINVAVVGV
jgi:hypothetical protein